MSCFKTKCTLDLLTVVVRLEFFFCFLLMLQFVTVLLILPFVRNYSVWEFLGLSLTFFCSNSTESFTSLLVAMQHLAECVCYTQIVTQDLQSL